MQCVHELIGSEIIDTPRMWLKALTPGVMDKVYTQLTDDQVMTFMGYGSATELRTEREKHAGGLTMHNRTFINFLLIRKDDGLVIGRAGFHTWMPMHSRAEIGYAMANSEFMGQGYMKEALRPIVKYGFDEMDLNRIEAFIGSHNTASIKLVTGMGFIKEGVLREHYCKNGIIEDSICYALLKREWKE